MEMKLNLGIFIFELMIYFLNKLELLLNEKNIFEYSYFVIDNFDINCLLYFIISIKVLLLIYLNIISKRYLLFKIIFN